MKAKLVTESFNESSNHFFQLVYEELLNMGYNDEEADFIMGEVTVTSLPRIHERGHIKEIAKDFAEKAMNKLV